MSDLKPCHSCGCQPSVDDGYVSGPAVSCSNKNCWMAFNGLPKGVWNTRPIEAALQSQISLLERSCATLTNERDEARKWAIKIRSSRDRAWKMTVFDRGTIKFPWEDKTDE